MKQRLFPRYFKWIGLSVIILPVIVALVARYIFNVQKLTHEEQWEQAFTSVILLGILFIILAREKHEDEFVDSCRLIAFRAAFTLGILSFILTPVFDLWGGSSSPRSILFTEMFFYLILFHALKRGIIQYGK